MIPFERAVKQEQTIRLIKAFDLPRLSTFCKIPRFLRLIGVLKIYQFIHSNYCFCLLFMKPNLKTMFPDRKHLNRGPTLIYMALTHTAVIF